MLNRENGALNVGRRLRINELRVPVFACPGPFSLGAKQRRGHRVRGMNREVEAGAEMKQGRRFGNGRLSKRGQCQPRETCDAEEQFHFLRSFRLWLSLAFKVMP